MTLSPPEERGTGRRFDRKPNGTPVTLDYFRERSRPDPETGCWIWQGNISPAGYGVTGVRSLRSKQAHRSAYEIVTGERVSSLLDICHRCDERRCVNPDHLFVGTRSDNMVDCREKGRLRTPFKKGQRASTSKLTEDQVREIRRATESNRKLAKRMGISRRAIQFVKTGRTWSWVAE